MKINKKDIKVIAGYAIFLLVLFLSLTINNKLFGSTMDYESQHQVFPDLFRQMFYQTFDFLPDYMMNVGGGQNIYTISYYGLLNPLLALSYLLPFVKMQHYLTVLMYLVVLSSGTLFYFYIKKEGFKDTTAIVFGFLVICSATLTQHSHRHMMFINYFPFLIGGLYAVDLYLEKKQSYLLVIMLSLILYCSYYYALGSYAALIFFGIYKYLKNNNYENVKNFVKWLTKFIVPFAIAGFISAILIFPTLHVLLNNRLESPVDLNIFNLIIPSNFVIYATYSPGITVFTFLAILITYKKTDKLNKVFVIFLILISSIPLFNFILNGFIYVSYKSLIPFLPVLLYFAVIGYEQIKEAVTKKYTIILIFEAVVLCIVVNFIDPLIDKTQYNDYLNINETIVELHDEDYYKVSNQTYNPMQSNSVFSMNQNINTIYSSTSNVDYYNFYYETLGNQKKDRTQFVMNYSQNIFSQIYLNEKYIYTYEELGKGYKLIDKVEDVYVYENINVMPLGYASNNYINIEDFNNLSTFDKNINILGNVITNKETSNNITYSRLLDESIIDTSSLIIENNVIKKGEYKLPINTTLHNEILFLSFDVNANKDELSIVINNQEEVLSSSKWKYYNNNTNFQYVLIEPTELNITISRDVEISNLKIAATSYSNLENINVDEFNVTSAIGDILKGEISVTEDSYFILNIPYDAAYTILVDGKEVAYDQANEAFIGFDITSGQHEITIEYKAPFKNISLGITCVSIVIAIVYCSVEIYLTKKNKVE